MEYTTEFDTLPDFGRVEKVFVAGRWVGMVYREPHPAPEWPGECWSAKTRRLEWAYSRDEAVGLVLARVQVDPDYEVI